ncbi:AAA family ATPase [Devosia sp.]|uniref:AAA family ATPase n=1 Tax=Devosia sp. TaxID=1871048 RepID=UPI001ACC8791|nr:AAA family ATPase [Devosia sp.]MBN9331925.1 AAA family ATPase [Devosia sp.]
MLAGTMFVLLNGSFGIGKTTTARRLVEALPDTAISDPEHVGFVLRRLPAFLLGLSRQPDDYQDMALWRRLIVPQARWVHGRAKTVVIPMAFTNRSYFADFVGALEGTGPVTKLCLVAPLDVIRSRLLERGTAEGRAGLTRFELRRSEECVAAHADPFFGQPIDATASPEAVSADILAVLSRKSPKK